MDAYDPSLWDDPSFCKWVDENMMVPSVRHELRVGPLPSRLTDEGMDANEWVTASHMLAKWQGSLESLRKAVFEYGLPVYCFVFDPEVTQALKVGWVADCVRGLGHYRSSSDETTFKVQWVCDPWKFVYLVSRSTSDLSELWPLFPACFHKEHVRFIEKRHPELAGNSILHFFTTSEICERWNLQLTFRAVLGRFSGNFRLVAVLVRMSDARGTRYCRWVAGS